MTCRLLVFRTQSVALEYLCESERLIGQAGASTLERPLQDCLLASAPGPK